MASPLKNNKKKTTNKKKKKTTTIVEDLTDQSPKNWSDLPTSLLHSILDLLSSSTPDILAFSAVCSQWRSLFKSTIPLPPLLLHLNPKDSSSFSLTQPFPKSPPPLHPTSPLSKPHPDSLIFSNCVGHSYGHLIFAFPPDGDALVVDVFSSKVFRSPKLYSRWSRYNISFGFLTAPPSSPSCMLLLFAWYPCIGSDILFWKLGAGDDWWSLLKLKPSRFIYSAPVFCGRRLFCLLYDHSLHEHSLLVFEDRHHITRPKVMKVGFPNAPKEYFVYHQKSLVECNLELFLLLFVRSRACKSLIKSRVYRLDFKNRVWVEVESIGDWCLFMDGGGRGFLAFPNPARWGGRSNCIYVSDSDSDSENGGFNVIPLDGTEFSDSLLNPRGEGLPPVWVHPS